MDNQAVEKQAINQVIANYASENANLRIQVEILKSQMEEMDRKNNEQSKE